MGEREDLMRMYHLFFQVILWMGLALTQLAPAQTRDLKSGDLIKLRSVDEVQFSPDGKRIAYTVKNHDGPSRPYSQVWILDLASGKSLRIGADGGSCCQAKTFCSPRRSQTTSPPSVLTGSSA